MRRGLIGFGIGTLTAWALMVLAFFAQLEGHLNTNWNSLAATLIWMVPFMALIVVVVGYVLK